MIKVMILDDDVNVRKCLRKLIPWEEMGYMIVAEATDGREGLKHFHETMPHVIITDLKMPEMDGEIFCQKIRSISDKVTIIFLSAYESFTAAQLSLHYGVSEYILKPLDTRKLEQITNILRNLSATFKNSALLHELINNSTLNEQFMEELRKKNADYFETFFQNMSSYPNRDFTLVHTTASIMLNLLFKVMEESPQTSSAIQLKRTQAFAELNSLTRKMDITSYVSEFFTNYLQSNNSNIPVCQNLNCKIVEQIKTYVLENISNSQLSVPIIADYFDFSDDYLGRIFKKYTGVSLISYITHIRLNQACRLLKNTQLTLTEIALAVGYSNSNYFCRVFKKQLNTTPNDFRKLP